MDIIIEIVSRIAMKVFGKIGACDARYIFLLLLILSAGSVIYFTTKYIRSSNWLSVAAILESINVIESPKDIAFFGLRPKIKEISYRYEINGAIYHGKRVSFFDFINKSSSDHKRLLELLKVSKTVNVFVNPKRPEESVIFRSVHAVTVPLLVLVVVSLFGFLFSLQMCVK